VLDNLCGNHTRGLPVDAFNRLFEKYLNDNLGSEFAAAAAASGRGSRLEMSGTALLRSLAKLAHHGRGEYAKGDGGEVHDQLVAEGHAWANTPIGRAELSKRQDWCLEECSKLFPLIYAFIKYTSTTRVLEPNVLRDTCSQLLELLHLQAYLHVGAAMWETAFEELRMLTNSTDVELNPLELNGIYDHLWAMGTLLQSDNSLDILAEDYRPWPKVESAAKFYARRASDAAPNLGAKRRELLREFKKDNADYVIILKEVLSLFGAGIHESLQRTMGDFLEATNGRKSLSKLEPWMKKRAVHLLAHNNHAERPFAVMKYYNNIFETMTLSNLSSLSLARCNNTYQRHPDNPKTQKTTTGKVVVGAAVDAHPKLQAAVSAVSSVRVKSLGEVTVLRREGAVADQAAATAHRKRRREEELHVKTRLALGRAKRVAEANSTTLVTTEAELDAKLAAKSGKGTKVELLRQQITARLGGARAFDYPRSAVWSAFRSAKLKSNPIRVTPGSGEDDLEYRTSLVKLMIAFDIQEDRYSVAMAVHSTILKGLLLSGSVVLVVICCLIFACCA
jgi:hypothetical protein